MKLILASAAGALAACASSGAPAPGVPAAGALSAPAGSEADLRARYQQYRTGPGPHLDYETWKRMFANPPDYTGAGS